MFLSQRQFNSLCEKVHLAIPQIIILGLYFLVASCSTTGPSQTADVHPDKRERHGKYRDHKFDYRKDRLSKKEKSTPKLEIPEGLESIADLKGFTDDLDRPSLNRVINNQLGVMYEQDPASPVRLGDFTLTRGRLVDTLEAFQKLLQKNLPQEEFDKKISEEFLLYRVGKGKNKKVLFTGYYRPVIPASPVPSPRFRFPIYQMPGKDFHRVNREPGIRLVGSNTGIKRIRGNKSGANWRNLTREDIDRKGALSDQGLEVAWLENEMERYFLHIQGSGVLEFPDGTRQGVRYQGSNRYPYNSIGKKMIRDGVITTSQGSMQEIKKYFAKNPQNISKYLNQNKRYIFFSLSDEGAIGSGGGELVGGRSIATDKSIYPAGGLVFVKVKKPVLGANNKIKSWKPISRFVVDQDTGSAIRGKARADLYFGTGKKAGAMAGHYHEKGEVYYLIKKS
ncbi:MAG: MltA domain-containing protein [Nitrospinota bacterium]